jgi:50S ribosomal subunit-associated GTPase HflX
MLRGYNSAYAFMIRPICTVLAALCTSFEVVETPNAHVQDMGAEDKLFATLDTRTRSVDLARDRKAVLVDTVGFIQQLPQHLVNAFRATLEESLQAEVLVCPLCLPVTFLCTLGG